MKNFSVLESNAPNTHKKLRSCRNKAISPLNLVYKETVSAQGHDDKTYIGMTEHAFKTRFNNHSLSFNHEKHSAKTTLSKYVWELKARKNRFLHQMVRQSHAAVISWFWPL